MRALLAALAAGVGSAVFAEAPPGVPAAESTELFDALETAPLIVLGTLEGRAALDARSWRARLAVEEVLAGALPTGQRLVIAWEELAASRPPRFADGDRLLLALEPLAAGSLWRSRVPDPRELRLLYSPTQQGTAFVRSPSVGSVLTLRHFLLLPQELRAGPAGQRHLLALTAGAEQALARSAARRLSSEPGPGELTADDAPTALRALARADADTELAALLMIWVERRQPIALVPALDAALAAPGGAPATFVRARGLLGDGLPSEREAALLASASVPHRVAAASVASAAQSERLAKLAGADPAPEVRVAALRRLARLTGRASLETLLDAFDDAEGTVRSEAALHAAAFGAEAVPRLIEVATRWSWPAPEPAVLALRLTGTDEARAGLTQLADDHPDPRVRALAGLAIGRSLGHSD